MYLWRMILHMDRKAIYEAYLDVCDVRGVKQTAVSQVTGISEHSLRQFKKNASLGMEKLQVLQLWLIENGYLDQGKDVLPVSAKATGSELGIVSTMEANDMEANKPALKDNSAKLVGNDFPFSDLGSLSRRAGDVYELTKEGYDFRVTTLGARLIMRVGQWLQEAAEIMLQWPQECERCKTINDCSSKKCSQCGAILANAVRVPPADNAQSKDT